VPGTPPLTDTAWAHLAPLLTTPPRRGKRRWEPRALLDGILWVQRTGASWREVPERFAPWHTVYDRYARWLRDGTWARILAALLPAGESR
jgi:transposase